ncbi:MAG: permease, partial [Candidatus Limnocylindrales bacterium]
MPPADVIPWVILQVTTSIIHIWPFLALGVMSAAALKVYVGTGRITGLFQRRTGYAVVGSVAAAVATPFCSCGTTAVVLSMIATTAPWAPIVAFMVASPLTSPDELFVSAGLFGWPLA